MRCVAIAATSHTRGRSLLAPLQLYWYHPPTFLSTQPRSFIADDASTLQAALLKWHGIDFTSLAALNQKLANGARNSALLMLLDVVQTAQKKEALKDRIYAEERFFRKLSDQNPNQVQQGLRRLCKAGLLVVLRRSAPCFLPAPETHYLIVRTAPLPPDAQVCAALRCGCCGC